MPGLPSTYFFLHKKFHDLYDFSHSVHSWDADFRQLDSGSFKADLLQVDLGNFQFTNAHFNRHLIQRGSSPPNFYTFALPANPSQQIIWRGKELRQNSIMVYSPAMEIDGVTWPGFNVYTFSIPLERLEIVSRQSGYPATRNCLFDRDVLTCTGSLIGKLRQLLRAFCSQLEEKRSQAAVQTLYSQSDASILEYLHAACESSGPVTYYDSSPLRERALKKAVAYITAYSQECPTVQMICQATGVSKRTLEYAFLERFGVSPKTYLQTFRLNGAYRELRKSDPSSTKVIDVANHWGFWHMGQFAADYRKLFGDLPSKTLGRSAPVHRKKP